ncbi:MAG: polymer-forming cytoskeletal protein [Saccharofermentanales bacterium]
MKDESIEGIGTIHSGEYGKVSIDGVGKLKGGVIADSIYIDGLFKSKGKIIADNVEIDGIARVFRKMKVKSLNIQGILKLRRASVSAGEITSDGVLVCTREISADNIYIDGVCSISRLYGENINICNKAFVLQESKLPAILKRFSKIYFGRNISNSHSIADTIECTEISASGLKSKVIRANKVNLTNNCIVGKLYCDGEMIIDESCKIGKIISNIKPLIKDKETVIMANPILIKILEMYKNGKIDADEAEKMFGSININPLQNENATQDLPWSNDGKLRIVAYIGRKLLKKGEEDLSKFEIHYDGAALNVESFGNIICGDIAGNATAGSSIEAGDIGGNVSCGGKISCKDITGNIAAGGGVRIER